VIIEFDGREFASVVELRLYVYDLSIGRQVPVRVLRGREKMTLTMEIGPKRRYDSEFSI